MRNRIGFLALVVAALGALTARIAHSASDTGGTVTGSAVDAATHAALEGANVVLRSRADSTRIVGMLSAADGSFQFVRVAFGAYVIECSQIGHRSVRTPLFTLDAANPRVDLRAIALKPSALVLDEVQVSGERSVFRHDIDRHVYNVSKDLMAKASSVSDLLQNIPSVQVDVDGNVSLRGSPDVMILINGKKSALMGASRADVLQQLPAASIEKIEVITNPSARFTPEGASGIINIVTQKGAVAVGGDLTAHLGDQGRHNEGLSFSSHPGKFDVFGNYNFRENLRTRTGSDVRTLTMGPLRSYREDNQVFMRPHAHAATLGLTYHASARNTFELSGEYFRFKPTRDGRSHIVGTDSTGAITSDLERLQSGYELHREEGLTGAFEHSFSRDGAEEEHTLRIEASGSGAPQSEPAHFQDHWRNPPQPGAASDVTLTTAEHQGHVSIDYSDPLGEDSRFETGYAVDVIRQDIHSDADTLDASAGLRRADPNKTYHFRLDQAVQALYATYQRPLGALSALGGLRFEYAAVTPDLLSQGERIAQTYTGLYPTLHLAYASGKRSTWQLNYSRRIRRPEADDLNPFPEFTDPYNIDSGNPRLRPESTHSYELGYRFRGDHLSFSPTLYIRDKRDGLTRITQALNDSTFVRTQANLSSDRSFGLEPVFTCSAGMLQASLNANVFHQQIDAANLGFSGTRSVTSWSANMTATFTPHHASAVEATANYRAARLTPQGDSRPSFVLNMGIRQDVLGNRFTFTCSVSDMLKTQRQETTLDVAGIHQHVTNHRDYQVLNAGLTYHFGRPAKNDKDKKDKPIQYEDAQ